MGELSESRLIPSVSHLRQFRADELADLAVLYICGLYVLFMNKETKSFAVSYARRSVQYGVKFDKWHGGATDLFAILFGLEAHGVQLDEPESSDKFKKSVPIGATALVRWLKEMQGGHVSDADTRYLFTRLDFNFKIRNPSIRAVRRLAMDWSNLDTHDRQLVMTRLLQLMRNRAARGEILQQLRNLAHKHDWELSGVCDKETGVGCGGEEELAPREKKDKKMGMLVALAGVAAGIAAANLYDKAHDKGKK
jgi:hypothetical protein